MKLIYTIFATTFIMFCPILHPFSYSVTKADQLVYSSMKKISYGMQKQYGLTGGFCGCGKDNEGFWRVTFIFDRNGSPLSIEEARRFAISLTENILYCINQDTKIRPLLKNYPYSQKNVQIIVNNYSKDRKEIFHPYIGGIISSTGRLSFSTNDPNCQYKELSDTEETYDEALAIIRGQKGTCDLNNHP